MPGAGRGINRDASGVARCYIDGMNRILPAPELEVIVDEAALDTFVTSSGFDQFLLDCFAEGIREAMEEYRALGLDRPAAE